MAQFSPDALIRKLNAIATKAVKPASVSVGFTQSYAIYVHENLEAKHTNGQAKFLEQPYREMTDSGELLQIVKDTVRGGGSLEQGLLKAGLALQRAAQLLTPVLTGALRNSAFTRLEK
jgi:hypothetical protein